MDVTILRWLYCPFCGGKFSISSGEQTSSSIEYGTLTCYCDCYPIVAHIPVLKKDVTGAISTIVSLIKAGQHREALLRLLAPVSPGLAPAWTQSLPSNLGARWIKRQTHDRALREWKENASALLLDQRKQATARDIFAFYLRKKEVYNYFTFRFAQPRHLVLLSFVSLIQHPETPVLDLACGCGHLTRSLVQRAKDQLVIGVDDNFFGLYVAKHWIAPEAEYISCAADSSLPFPNAAFSVTFCADAFHYFTNKAVSIREIRRLTQDNGLIMLLWVHNLLVRRPYDGIPLPPEGYQALVVDLPHRLVADSGVLTRYLQKQGPLLACSADLARLANEPLLSIVASRRQDVFQDHGAFVDWPHAEGSLQLNPLYVREELNGAGIVKLRRTFPSAFYEEEHAESKKYLPEAVELSSEVWTQIVRGERTAEVNRLIDQYVVVGMPERYQ